MELTDKQTRALWAHALHDLAEAIGHYGAVIPTSIDVWVQRGVTLSSLLLMADETTPSIPVKVNSPSPERSYAALTIPTGEPLGLPIKTHVHSDEKKLDDFDMTNIEFHNEHCCSTDAPDAGPSPAQHGSSDPEADITHCAKCFQPVPAEYMAEHLAARHVPAGEYDQADVSDR